MGKARRPNSSRGPPGWLWTLGGALLGALLALSAVLPSLDSAGLGETPYRDAVTIGVATVGACALRLVGCLFIAACALRLVGCLFIAACVGSLRAFLNSGYARYWQPSFRGVRGRMESQAYFWPLALSLLFPAIGAYYLVRWYLAAPDTQRDAVNRGAVGGVAGAVLLLFGAPLAVRLLAWAAHKGRAPSLPGGRAPKP